jgi:hypothetical protein
MFFLQTKETNFHPSLSEKWPTYNIIKRTRRYSESNNKWGPT